MKWEQERGLEHMLEGRAGSSEEHSATPAVAGCGCGSCCCCAASAALPAGLAGHHVLLPSQTLEPTGGCNAPPHPHTPRQRWSCTSSGVCACRGWHCCSSPCPCCTGTETGCRKLTCGQDGACHGARHGAQQPPPSSSSSYCPLHHQHQPVHATHGCCFCSVLSAADTQRKTKEGDFRGPQRFA